ncbi:MAG TPA: pseudouridine synthase [Fimbriimonadaceae bacterium]|nr:pseudouridine synthase [Fimbriimonadaceae bacterium]HRJ32586.1 pseudouridine synthase [Fimbriimonadaceae bacterium]
MPSPETTHEEVRLHKFIASCGVTSRRKAEELIREGRVTVNGEIVTEMGTKVGPDDHVTVDGEGLRPSRLFYILMNKPKGVVTTLDDPQKRRTVKEYLPDVGVRLKPVGRLDMDTEGLILFTNDGELAARMTHAQYGLEKEYQASVAGEMQDRSAMKLAKGVPIEGRKTSPAIFEITGYDPRRNLTHLRIVLHEGRKRQIREMCALVGHEVLSLKRVRIGHLVLRNLAPGQCRALGQFDVKKLRSEVGLD